MRNKKKMRMNMEFVEIHSHSPTHSHSDLAGLERQVLNCFVEGMVVILNYLSFTSI
jgi:hypothetical protein